MKSGSEGAIHSMRELFHDSDTEGLILIDASNAFNRINRGVALHNVQILCPEVSTYLINTYRSPPSLVIRGENNTGQEISSFEGTTQGIGYNLGMTFYCLATVPIIHYLKSRVEREKLNCKQCWLADDATAVGQLVAIRKWFDWLVETGYKHGYFVNESKTWLIIKNPDDLGRAAEIFKGTSVQLTTEGKRHLGACIGSESYKEEYCRKLVSKWCTEVEYLSEIAKNHPHEAYCNYIHSYQHKYTYYLRTIPDFEQYLKPIDDIVTYCFLPTLFGSPLTSVERQIVSLPTRLGGLGIHVLAENAPKEFASSMALTYKLRSAIKQQSLIGEEICKETLQLVKTNRDMFLKAKFETLKLEVSPPVKRVLEVLSEKGASNWLNALPLQSQGFSLTKSEFMDAINIRYFRELRGLPTTCACGNKFNITHALNCKKGGFIHQRHDALRDLIAELLSRVQKDVETEPALQPVQGEETESSNVADGARVDIRARGFWRQGQNSFYDVRVFNPMSATSMKSSLEACFRNQEREKKRAYNQRIMEVDGGTFTPLVFSVFGTPGKESSNFLKSLSNKLSTKMIDRMDSVTCWLRCKISFMCINYCGVCLRGSRMLRKKEYISNDFSFDAQDANIS